MTDDDTSTTPQTAEQAMRAFVKELFRGDPADDTTFTNPKEDTP